MAQLKASCSAMVTIGNMAPMLDFAFGDCKTTTHEARWGKNEHGCLCQSRNSFTFAVRRIPMVRFQSAFASVWSRTEERQSPKSLVMAGEMPNCRNCGVMRARKFPCKCCENPVAKWRGLRHRLNFETSRRVTQSTACCYGTRLVIVLWHCAPMMLWAAE